MKKEAICGAVVAFIVFIVFWSSQSPIPKTNTTYDLNEAVRVIHQIWFQGESAVPDKYDAYRESCKRVNDGWKIMIHDDASLRSACEKLDQAYPEVKLTELYDGAETMYEKIDMGRMALIWLYGGVSIDMDMKCIKSLDRIMEKIPPENIGLALRSYSLFYNMIERFRLGIEMSKFALVNNAVWVAPKPKNAVMIEILKKMSNSVRAIYMENKDMKKFTRIDSTWGPTALTRAIQGLSKITFFSQQTLEKTAYFDSACDNAESCLCHIHDLSWYDTEVKMAADVARPLWQLYADYPLFCDVLLCVASGALIGSAFAIVRR